MSNPYSKCPNCGKRHKPRTEAGAICTMEEMVPRRVRMRCPYHKHLCYGLRRFYYDTVRTFLDCGTFVDHGYGEWREPEEVTRARWRAAYQRRKARKAAA